MSHRTGGQLLTGLNDRWPGTRNTRAGVSPPDRNAPLASINAQLKACQQRGQPVLSVDTQQQALVGDFANEGRESQPQGVPARVRVHDLVDKRLGTAIPYGVSDLTHHGGWVGVGVEPETAACAVATVPQWWQRMGQPMDPQAPHVRMTADGGGSHGRRSRLWNVARQRLSDATGLAVRVGHVPPGTSTWHKIEQRLLCHRTEHGRGRPLVSQEVIVHLMAKTTTAAGLRVEAALDLTPDETGTKVADAALAHVNLSPADFHGHAWTYVITPRDKHQ